MTFHPKLSEKCHNEVQSNLIDLITKTDYSRLLSVVLLNLRTRQIPHAFSCYLLVWQDAGALYEECLAPPLLLPLFISMAWGSWQGYQVLPAISAVSILELAADRGSSRMSKAPNLHLAMRLLMAFLLCNRNAMLVTCW